jgi:hypothetical protein
MVLTLWVHAVQGQKTGAVESFASQRSGVIGPPFEWPAILALPDGRIVAGLTSLCLGASNTQINYRQQQRSLRQCGQASECW